jgi:hypothetical protein
MTASIDARLTKLEHCLGLGPEDELLDISLVIAALLARPLRSGPVRMGGGGLQGKGDGRRMPRGA